MIYHTGCAHKIKTDNFHIDIASNINRIAAKVANHHGCPGWIGAEHKEVVIPFQGIHFQSFNTFIDHIQSGAIDALAGDDNIIGEFCAKDGDSIKSVSTINTDRRIDHILDRVVARTAINLGHGLFGILVQDHKGTDDKGIIIITAFKP